MSHQPDYEHILKELMAWTDRSMKKIGASKAIIGVSGGKDSSVTAALMTKVLGKENVIGVLMPDGEQGDIDYSYSICDHLGIQAIEANIAPITKAFLETMDAALDNETTQQTKLNLPPRVRMALLYGISQSIPGSLVINTSNMSEDWVGYATVYGDTTGAFSPLGMLTTEDVIAIGRLLGVPENHLIKPPADGLTGKTDEDVLGVTYHEINEYIRHNRGEEESLEKIKRLHRISRFKFLPIPMFDPGLPILGEDVQEVYQFQSDHQ